jgi:hypothetical protein
MGYSPLRLTAPSEPQFETTASGGEFDPRRLKNQLIELKKIHAYSMHFLSKLN